MTQFLFYYYSFLGGGGAKRHSLNICSVCAMLAQLIRSLTAS